MQLRADNVCQYLKGSEEGAQCNVMNTLVRVLEDADIRICMGRHHEACSYYILSLRRCVARGDLACESL